MHLSKTPKVIPSHEFGFMPPKLYRPIIGFALVLLSAILWFWNQEQVDFINRLTLTNKSDNSSNQTAEKASSLTSNSISAAAPTEGKQKKHQLSPKKIEEVRSEIKTSLASIYGAEKSFYSEFKRYSTDLKALGFFPDKKDRWSKMGFLTPFFPIRPDLKTEDPRIMDLDALARTELDDSKRLAFKPTADFSMEDLQKYCQQGCTASEDQFEIIAGAILAEGNPPDVWVINEKKEIHQIQDGLKPIK